MIVVADTSWGLTCHTQSAAHPCSPRSSCCAPHPSLSSRQAHATPTIDWDSLSPLSLSFFLFLFSRFLHPTTLYQHASGDTRGPTQVMHGPPYIFDPLFGLFFPTGSNVRCLSCLRRALTSPIVLRTLALSPRAVARWKDHDCPRLSFALSVLSSSHPPSSSWPCVQHAVLLNKHPRCTSVTPVIVRLLTGMYANDMLGASRRDGPCARVYSDATLDPGSCRKPPPPDGHIEISSFRNIEAHMMPRRHARAQASFMPLVNRELGRNGEVKSKLSSISIFFFLNIPILIM